MFSLHSFSARSFLLALTALSLNACSDDTPPRTFSTPDFSYLAPLHLNVASITVEDQAVPKPDSLNAQAPTPPDSALTILAKQRLVSTGATGQGQFIIKQAYLQQTSDDALDGAMDVQLNVADANNQHTGYVHARVTRHFTTTDQSASSRASLDALTQQMTQDMNVELEYQIRHRLMAWLTDAEGNPLTGAIQQQSLTAPGTQPQTAPSPTATQAAATPAATTQAAAPPQTLPASPPATNSAATTNSTIKTDTNSAQPASSLTPDAIFPTGQSNAATTKVTTHSPKSGTLKLPPTKDTQSH